MIFGFRESLKHLKVGDTEFIVIATNIIKTEGEESTDETLLEILKIA